MSTNEETNLATSETPTPTSTLSISTSHVTTCSTEANKIFEVLSKVQKQREPPQFTSVVLDHFTKFVDEKENVKPKLYNLFEECVSNTCASSSISSHSMSNLPKQTGEGTKPKGSKIFNMIMIQTLRHHCYPNKIQIFCLKLRIEEDINKS
ncbi:uncharacterized protein LOC110426918 [Herrania umbratica]|uniref:Uncharacterized protein LOC110426918 n=1 Tax=Herrania umbratica TaxID=108875 RepID=A0A6J1BEW7_9ROSI|nr:uncharacterized protein LOC110426918 [Herrania umbratica]